MPYRKGLPVLNQPHEEEQKPLRHVLLAETADIEAVLGDTIVRVLEIDERTIRIEKQCALIPTMEALMQSVASAQQLMAASAQSSAESARSIAESVERGEKRQEAAERRYDNLVQLNSGKGQIPLETHSFTVKWMLIALMVPTCVMGIGSVCAVVYFTNARIETKLVTIETNQAVTQKKVERVEEKVSQVAGDVNQDAENREEQSK